MKSIIILLAIICLFGSTGIRADHDVAGLEVYPQSATMNPRFTLQFTIVANTHSDTQYTPEDVEWRAEGGSITQDGRYTAGNRPGRYEIVARWGEMKKKVYVVIKHSQPKISRIVVTPPQTTLNIGGSYQFEASAYDSSNRPVAFTPIWSVNGGGRINESGLFRATELGEYTVVAKDSYSAVRGIAKIWIREKHNPVHRIEIVPPQAVVPVNSTAQFSAKAYDYQGKPLHFDPVWGTNGGGKIDQNGYYSTGNYTGNFQIWARDQKTGVKAVAYVQVVNQPAGGRIEIKDWDVGGGNFFRPKGKITCKVYGEYAQRVSAIGIASNGNEEELKTRSCKDGDEVRLEFKFDLWIKWVEIRLYDNMNKVIARYKRVAD